MCYEEVDCMSVGRVAVEKGREMDREVEGAMEGGRERERK